MSREGSYPSKRCPIPPVEQKLCLMEPIRLTKHWSEPPPGAMFTFQMIKTVSGETELGYDGGRSVCFR